MKQFLLLIAFIVSYSVFSQSLPYAAVVRDGAGNPVSNSSVGVSINLREGSDNGPVEFNQNLSANTDSNGLISFAIGPLSNNIDFSATTYFVEVAIDIAGGTNYSTVNNQPLLAVPYSIYSDRALTADSIDYSNVQNTPSTITTAEQDKLALISVTQNVDLDQLATDVVANNGKVSFPGFGTTAGTALEGDKTVWIKDANNNIFYDQGGLGIGLSPGTDLNDAKLVVNGNINFPSVTSIPTEPGTLFYDATANNGDGGFFFVNNSGTAIAVDASGQSFTNTGSPWQLIDGNTVASGNAGVFGSFGIGLDFANNYDFGFNTFVMRENNTRILFDDTDTDPGVPNNDWQIEANSSSNGGGNYLAINDITNATQPFRIDAGAPSESLVVSSSGNVGIGTASPGSKLTVNGSVEATAFIGDGSGLTGLTGSTGGISNPDDTVIEADNDADSIGIIALRTGNADRMVISNNGNVGIGTTTPTTELEVAGSIKTDQLDIQGFANPVLLTKRSGSFNENDITNDQLNVANEAILTYNSSNVATLNSLMGGVDGQQITIVVVNQGGLSLIHGATGVTAPLQLPQGSDLTLGFGSSATLIYINSTWILIELNS